MGRPNYSKGRKCLCGVAITNYSSKCAKCSARSTAVTRKLAWLQHHTAAQGKRRKTEEEKREQRRQYDAGRAHARSQNRIHDFHPDRKIIPAEVLAEREAVMSQPVTLNMAVMGDPLPGRSALDRRLLGGGA